MAIKRRYDVESVVEEAPKTKKQLRAEARAAKKAKKKEKKDYTFKEYPYLVAIKPKECYIFHSDYFEIDNQVATILAYFHNDGAIDNYGPFWGINRIPAGLPDNVTVFTFEGISRFGEGWIQKHQVKAEGIAAMDNQEVGRSGTSTSKHQAGRKTADFETIGRELQSGASYLNVQYRLLLKAPDLETLDYAIDQLKRLYIDRFGTLSAAAYAGEQKTELSTLFGMNEKRLGKGFCFTSNEYAGSYSLVTHGLEDAAGEYVGYMVGDVNNSAVLFDVDNYKHHTVIVNENYHEKLGRVHVSDMWGSKISQSALLNNHRVVHVMLNGCNMDKIGPKFESLTYKIDMNHGAVNMFEMFGEAHDEMNIYPQQMEKLILMAEQAYAPTDSDRSIIRGNMEKIATQFYIDRGMWRENAKEHRDELRIVGIPHGEVPRLQEFVSYLDSYYKAEKAASARDNEQIHALNVLSSTFSNLLSSNGDLFNTVTDATIDGVVKGQRVLYDFGDLIRRGKGVAMAQLVNIIGFAIGNLGLGDVVIFHGTDLIDNGVKSYIDTQLNHLYSKGGRVVFCYDDTDTMLDDKDFCHFDKADYTIFGNMTDTTVENYQTLLGQDIPPDLSALITSKSDKVCYIRRGFDNVVFKQDLALGINSTKPTKDKRMRKRKLVNRG